MSQIFGRLFLYYFLPILAILNILFYFFEFNFLKNCAILGTLSIIAWEIAYRVFDLLHDEIVTEKNKIVVITGCDTGFGNSLAYRLDKFGFYVYACVYSLESDGAKQLSKKCSHRIRVVQMDVTKPEQVDAVYHQVRDENLPLWAVVNNAGILLETPFEWGNDIEVLQKTFEVNVYGVARVTKTFVNLLRQSQGRVVNIASAAGRLTAPLISYYCMSKHAVRSFSDAIRRELGNFGVDVVTIEPAFYKTQILNFDEIEAANRYYFEHSQPETKAYYNKEYFAKIKKTHRIVSLLTRSNTEEVVNELVNAVTKVTIKPYIRCCGYLDLLWIWIHAKLPETFADYILSF